MPGCGLHMLAANPDERKPRINPDERKPRINTDEHVQSNDRRTLKGKVYIPNLSAKTSEIY